MTAETSAGASPSENENPGVGGRAGAGVIAAGRGGLLRGVVAAALLLALILGRLPPLGGLGRRLLGRLRLRPTLGDATALGGLRRLLLSLLSLLGGGLALRLDLLLPGLPGTGRGFRLGLLCLLRLGRALGATLLALGLLLLGGAGAFGALLLPLGLLTLGASALGGLLLLLLLLSRLLLGGPLALLLLGPGGATLLAGGVRLRLDLLLAGAATATRLVAAFGLGGRPLGGLGSARRRVDAGFRRGLARGASGLFAGFLRLLVSPVGVALLLGTVRAAGGVAGGGGRRGNVLPCSRRSAGRAGWRVAGWPDPGPGAVGVPADARPAGPGARRRKGCDRRGRGRVGWPGSG